MYYYRMYVFVLHVYFFHYPYYDPVATSCRPNFALKKIDTYYQCYIPMGLGEGLRKIATIIACSALSANDALMMSVMLDESGVLELNAYTPVLQMRTTEW